MLIDTAVVVEVHVCPVDGGNVLIDRCVVAEAPVAAPRTDRVLIDAGVEAGMHVPVPGRAGSCGSTVAARVGMSVSAH